MKINHAKRDPLSYDPRKPHPYQSVDDAGLGAMSAGGFSSRTGGSAVTSIAVTNRYQRTEGCGVPGCGKSRDAAIHAPEE